MISKEELEERASAIKPRFTDTRLKYGRTPHYYEQFALPVGREIP